MRPVNEINDPAKLLEFAKSKRLLQFSSHESLGEITSLLYKVIVLADKNMPIKAYLDVIRQLQGVSRQVEVLDALNRIEASVRGGEDFPGKEQALSALAQAKGAQVMGDFNKTLQDKVGVLQDLLSPYKAIHTSMENAVGALRPLAFEDEFVLAVAFLDLEVSKLGAITYLKGESADYKETKRNRTLLDTRDESVLKTLSAGLTRPNDERGSVEMGMIDSAYNRLVKLNQLHELMPEVVRRLNNDSTKLDVLRDIGLTLTDYDIISRMARREKLMTFRNRQKDPANSYELRTDNHQRVKALADKWGVTPRRALNKILDDFFVLTSKHAQYGSTKPKSSKGG